MTEMRISKDKVYDESGYPRHSRILHSGLKEHERLPWSWFKTHPAYEPDDCDFESEGGVSIELDHLVVPVVSKFAITAFNKLCGLYYKKKVDENIYEAQVTQVMCLPNSFGYMFSIEVEALEENVVGVYEAKVLSTPYGRRTLISFTRTLRSPTGIKYGGIDDLTSVKLVSDALKEKKKYLKSLLKEKDKAVKTNKKPPSLSAYPGLETDYAAFVGACRLVDGDVPQLNQGRLKIKTSKSAKWLVPDEKTGLQRRSNEHTFGGYDYVNPLKVFSSYK